MDITVTMLSGSPGILIEMKPLEGINILEFSTMITASFAAMMLAEQGARVIKVEPIELGDPMRFLGSAKGGISALFANCNRGKRSLRLDLKSDQGKRIIEELIQDTDIVLCNYRPGVMDSLGLGSEHLRSLNPQLIYVAINGFGIKGPDRDKPAYDQIIQTQVGFPTVQGHGADSPKMVRNLVCDKSTAYTACQAATAALFLREKNGEGQHIDIAMMDAGLFFLFPDGFMHETLLDEDAEHLAPLSERGFELTNTRDGSVAVAAATEAQLVGLVAAVDQLHLFADERFDSQEKLRENFTEFKALVRAAFSNFDTDEVLKRLAENDVPATKYHDYRDVLNHPQYAANATIDEFEHPIMGNMRRVKSPAQFHGERLAPASNAPAHGEHTRDVLSETGMTSAEIDELIQQGIAKEQDP